MVEHHRTGHNPPGVAAEILKQRELLLSELQFKWATPSFASNEIKLKVRHSQASGFLLAWRASAQQSAQPCQYFCDRKWFGEVVVSTALQPEDELIKGTACGENEHWRGDTLSAQPLNEIQPVHIRQREIDDHRVKSAFNGQRLGLSAMSARIYAKAGLDECPAEKIPDCVVVFDYQQPQ
jgi:hypothetical protein